jgi:hypothetical protein
VTGLGHVGHVDFAGPFMDSMLLVLVCAHAKWPEVVQMKTTTSTKTIEALRMIFCRTGITKQIVSENGHNLRQGNLRTLQSKMELNTYIKGSSELSICPPIHLWSFPL